MTPEPPARRRHSFRVVVPGLLLTSLACNVAALVLPFMQFDVFLQGTTGYSLPRSVSLLWSSGLYAIALLVVAFSIVFPFAKLAAQGWIWFTRIDAARRARVLAWLERLGKWSFLDIFVVCVILVLSTDQLLVGATPKVGLYLFVVAIALSMLSAALIARMLHEPDAGGRSRGALAARRGWRRWTVPPLLGVTAAALGAALTVPYLGIDDFFFADHDFSIVRSALALGAEGFPGTALLVGVTLVAVPAASVLAMLVTWFAPMRAAARRRWRRGLELGWQWSMLDVFGLALVVFLLEGDQFVETETRLGLPLFLGAAVLLSVSHAVVIGATRGKDVR